MADIEQLTDMSEWELLWDEEASEDAGAVVIFKHSPICPASARALDVFERFVRDLPSSKDLRILQVDVISSRPISQRIATDTGVKHESPQVLLLSRGHNVRWQASHGAITPEALGEALAEAHV